MFQVVSATSFVRLAGSRRWRYCTLQQPLGAVHVRQLHCECQPHCVLSALQHCGAGGGEPALQQPTRAVHVRRLHCQCHPLCVLSARQHCGAGGSEPASQQPARAVHVRRLHCDATCFVSRPLGSTAVLAALRMRCSCLRAQRMCGGCIANTTYFVFCPLCGTAVLVVVSPRRSSLWAQ